MVIDQWGDAVRSAAVLPSEGGRVCGRGGDGDGVVGEQPPRGVHDETAALHTRAPAPPICRSHAAGHPAVLRHQRRKYSTRTDDDCPASMPYVQPPRR